MAAANDCTVFIFDSELLFVLVVEPIYLQYIYLADHLFLMFFPIFYIVWFSLSPQG